MQRTSEVVTPRRRARAALAGAVLAPVAFWFGVLLESGAVSLISRLTFVVACALMALGPGLPSGGARLRIWARLRVRATTAQVPFPLVAAVVVSSAAALLVGATVLLLRLLGFA